MSVPIIIQVHWYKGGISVALPAINSDAVTKPSGINRLVSNYLVRRGFRRLKRWIQALEQGRLSPERTVELLFSAPAALIQPWQFEEELLPFAREVHARNPKTVVEIGTANGGTLFMATRVAADDALIISIDLPGGKFGGGYPAWKAPYYQSFARLRQRLHLLRADSHEPSTLRALEGLLDGRMVDYLLIDGDHSYAGVKQDHEMYRHLVRPGGIIVFHDIAPHNRTDCQVDRYWNEVRTSGLYQEYIKQPPQGRFGVGLLNA